MNRQQLINRVAPTPKSCRGYKPEIIKKTCLTLSLKACVAFIIGALCCGPLPAQSFSEWFKQKKTQKKYLLEQIAALQMYRH